MPDINFLTIFHDKEDKQTLIKYCDEICELYGFPCKLKRWTGNQTALDPLYQDMPTVDDEDEDLFEPIDTFVYIDYQRFNSVLNAYGLSIEEGTTLEGMMRLQDDPHEDDVIEIYYPYDEKKYYFKIGSTDVHRDICYHVTLDVYIPDNKKQRKKKKVLPRQKAQER